MKQIETKLERTRRLTRNRMAKFREVHAGESRQFKVKLTVNKYNLIDTKLKERNMTKKEFLERAIDKFLEE